MSRLWPILIILVAILLSGSGCSLHGRQAASDDGRSLWNPTGSAKAVYKEPEEVVEEPFNPKKITDSATLKLKYAQWMEETGNQAEAKLNYAEVLKKDDKNVDAILGKARIELASGEVSAAEKGFRHALKVDSSSAQAYSGLGLCQSERKEWAAAAESLAKASTGLPEDKTIRHQLGIALVHTGNLQAAQLQFTQSVGAAAGHYNIALILKDEGRIPEAEEQLVMALRKDPSLKDAERWLSELRNTSAQNVSASVTGPSAIQPQITQTAYRNYGAIGTSSIEPAVYVTESTPASTASAGGHSAIQGMTQK